MKPSGFGVIIIRKGSMHIKRSIEVVIARRLLLQQQQLPK